MPPMRRPVLLTLLLLLLAVAGCAERGGVSGPYVGAGGGGNLRGDARLR